MPLALKFLTVRFSGALDFAFLTSSQVKLILLLWRCCFENYCSRKMYLEGEQGEVADEESEVGGSDKKIGPGERGQVIEGGCIYKHF